MGISYKQDKAKKTNYKTNLAYYLKNSVNVYFEEHEHDLQHIKPEDNIIYISEY